MSEALWFAGLAFAQFWIAGSLGDTSNTDKGMLGGAVVGSGVGALASRENSAVATVECRIRPTRAEVLKALPKAVERCLDDADVTYEKLSYRVDPPRFYPKVGQAEHHQAHWKCTVTLTENATVYAPFPVKVPMKRIEVVYIDKDHLVPCAAQEKLGGICAEPSTSADVKVDVEFQSTVQLADDALYPGRKIPGLKASVTLSSKADKKTMNADGTITVEMYHQDPAARGKPQLLSVWTFDAATLKTLRCAWYRPNDLPSSSPNGYSQGCSYDLFLPCDPEAAHVKNVKLEVKYTPKAGRALTAESTVLNLRYTDSQIVQAPPDVVYVAPPPPPPGQTEESAAPPMPIETRVAPATANRIAPRAALPSARTPSHAAAVDQRAMAHTAQVEIEAIVAQVDQAAWGMLPLYGNGRENVRFEVLTGKEKMIGALMALRSNGKAKIMAEPRVLTLSGQPGSIVSGGEMPIFVSSGEGAPRVSYKQFGTMINVLPVIQTNGRIHLDVQAEFAEPAAALNMRLPAGVVVPGFDVQHTQVGATISDGQTLVITGESLKRNGTEHRVILLTARVIQPVCCDAKPASTMTLTDVARLARRGISEDIILRQMELTEATFRLTVEDILSLHEQGVSENIIREIQMRAISGR